MFPAQRGGRIGLEAQRDGAVAKASRILLEAPAA